MVIGGTGYAAAADFDLLLTGGEDDVDQADLSQLLEDPAGLIPTSPDSPGTAIVNGTNWKVIGLAALAAAGLGTGVYFLFYKKKRKKKRKKRRKR